MNTKKYSATRVGATGMKTKHTTRHSTPQLASDTYSFSFVSTRMSVCQPPPQLPFHQLATASVIRLLAVMRPSKVARSFLVGKNRAPQMIFAQPENCVPPFSLRDTCRGHGKEHEKTQQGTATPNVQVIHIFFRFYADECLPTPPHLLLHQLAAASGWPQWTVSYISS